MMEQNNISNYSEGTEPVEIARLKEDVQKRKYLLLNSTIGISISESDNLQELGFDLIHLKDAMIEVARYIIALGGKVAYGGDMRQGGFTELLFELLAYYKADGNLPPHSRFFSFLSWPLSLKLSTDQEADLVHNVTFKRIPPPDDLDIEDLTEFLTPNRVEDFYIWAKCLTKMRKEMEEQCVARVLIGGRNKGFKGKMPGILEEVLIAVEKKHPVYLIGSFGGVTKDIIDAINGQSVNLFSEGYYTEDKEYASFMQFYNERNPSDIIDYTKYYLLLKNLGEKGLSSLNGLDEADNRRLAITPHVSEMVYLILKGLSKKIFFIK